MNSVGWCVCWIAGCGLGLLVVGRSGAGIEPGYGLAMLLLGVACAIPLWLGWPDRRARWTCLLSMAMLGGCGAALMIRPPITPGDLAYYNDMHIGLYNGPQDTSHVLMIGRISGEPVTSDRSQRFRFSVEQIRLPGANVPQPIRGDAYVVVARYPEREYGERLALYGTLTAPPKLSQFDYPAYLARQGIFSYMNFPRVTSLQSEDLGWSGTFLADARRSVRRTIQRGMPEPQAALAVGVVTGDRSQIPEGVQNALRRSGLVHLIAISGQNIALLTGAVLLLLGAKSKRRMTLFAFALTATMIILYTIFTGATPSVVRAAVMGVILLFAPVALRRYDPVASLAVAATVMVAFDPDLLADPGFQLSFAAMLGIALLAPPLYELTKRWRIPTLLGVPIAVSVAAQATTIPLSALLFGLISTVALPATLSVEIALLPLMATGIAEGLFGVAFPPLDALFGALAWPFAAWILWWAQLWAALPWAAHDVSGANPMWVIVYYGALLACMWLVKKGKKQQLVKSDFAMAALTVGALGLWATFFAVALG